VIATSRSELDITEKNQVDSFLAKVKPKWVINTAAYTQVDLAEKEREKALAINFTGPKFLMEASKREGAKLVHFSTDYVFSGEGSRPWSENDIPAPLEPNWYAKTKLLGEEAVLSEKENLVCRVQWLYGSKRNRFSSLKDKNKFTPFSDQFGAPTWTKDIVGWVLALLQKDATGVFHLAYDDYASWFEVYEFVKKKWELSVELIPSLSQDVSLSAKRPLNGRLCNRKLADFLELKSVGSWKDSLTRFLEMAKP
jgi:dTDP-4-dehydrorhamnose reductase